MRRQYDNFNNQQGNRPFNNYPRQGYDNDRNERYPNQGQRDFNRGYDRRRLGNNDRQFDNNFRNYQPVQKNLPPPESIPIE